MQIDQNSYGPIQYCSVCPEPLEKPRSHFGRPAICLRCQRHRAKIQQQKAREADPARFARYKATREKNMLKPYNHQQKIIDLNPKKYLIAHGCGLGKTQTSLFLAQKNSETALIVVPKGLKMNWSRAIQDFNPDHMIISKEDMRKNWDSLPFYNTLILDEFHFWANTKSQMSKSLQSYIKKHNPEYIYGLTATPFCSSPLNIFALGRHLGHNWSYWSFFNKFFQQVKMGTRMIPVQRKGMEGEVADLVRQIGDTCKMEDCVDVPDQTFETVYFELTPSQIKGIKAIDDTEPIVRFTRTHTIEQGLRIGDEYVESEYFDSLKNDYIVAFADENPKFAVVCRYNMQIYMLRDILEKKGKKVFVINGEVKNRDEIVQAVENSVECVVLLQADTAVGFELPSVPVMIFASLSFSFVAHEQSIGRIHRINKLKKNLYQYLIVKGGVDEAVYDCIMKKQDFNIAIYDK